MKMTVTSYNRVPQAMRAVRAAAWVAVEDAAEAMRKAAVDSVESAIGTGRKYSNLPKQSSAPGEVPVAQRVDGIVKSIKTYAKPLGPDHPAADCGSDDPTVPGLDRGTSRVAPRPFMTAASVKGAESLRNAGPKIGRSLHNLKK